MDKDSVILKYINDETENCTKDLCKLSSLNNNNIERINQIDSKVDEIYKFLNKERKNIIQDNKKQNKDNFNVVSKNEQSYDDLFMIASKTLTERGIDTENIDYHDLVSEEQLSYIIDHLNRPLDKKLKWNKNDFIAVFIAGSIGSLVDCILSNRENKFTGKGSQFEAWLDQFHKHDGGAPIDYQGKGFGGGFHRGLSRGHDILRFIEAIMMFKTGRFEGIRYTNGVAEKVVSSVNQYGNPYEELGLIEAIFKYAQHMFGDLCSKCSLPFPGSSFLAECGNREIRIFAATMYKQGFNLKNIMIQSLSTIIVEIILRIYFGIDEVRRYKDSIEIEEDYSNFKAIEKFVKPSSKEKLYEMLLLSHTMVAGINIGKVVITKKPWEINITEIISVIRYAVPVVNNTINRHSEYSKIIRNVDEINNEWNTLKEDNFVDKLYLEFPDNIIQV